MRATWLADVLRSAGLHVVEVDGWKSRGKEMRAIHGVVWHHTATGTSWTDQRVTDLLRDGRTDLAGPLSQLGLARDGTFYVVAAGRSNHNGYGTWDNDSLGIEAYNAGDGRDPWPAAQVDAYVRGTAAILTRLGLPASKALGHRETDPRRKVDPRGLDMAEMRRRVAAVMAAPAPTPTPPPPKDGFLMALTDDQQRRVYDLLEAADLRLTALDQRLARVEAALNTDGNDHGKPPYPPRIVQSLARVESRLSELRGIVTDLASAAPKS